MCSSCAISLFPSVVSAIRCSLFLSLLLCLGSSLCLCISVVTSFFRYVFCFNCSLVSSVGGSFDI